jgi:hypothetical protein
MKAPIAVTLMIGLALAMPSPAATRFEISFPASVHATPVTGRLFLIFAQDGGAEPRLERSQEMLAVDVRAVKPDQAAVMDGDTPGLPARNIGGVPPGDYFVQAVLNVYTEFHRADGHTIWAHMDQWEGQQFESSPGNLVSEPQKIHLDTAGGNFKVNLNRVIPPIQMPADTEWVRRIKFESKLLSEFWGHPIYIGATVLLPKGYDAHSGVRYPVIYLQGHFSMDAPFGFSTEPGHPL